MQAYIAEMSDPAHPDVEFIEEQRLIVLAESPGATEAAFREFAGPNKLIRLTHESPLAGYLEQAGLKPGVVKGYNS